MYCPMKFNNDVFDQHGMIYKEACECEKEKCAWWIVNIKRTIPVPASAGRTVWITSDEGCCAIKNITSFKNILEED